ncbi:hypothetical protein RHGRI_012130 [Rhododendron griersonianum]|uniref:Uncharacterized protein n=1 Tax=Rhododendron griersonianum TaxID=479676 RepID=A0AAV6KQS7_9ERIC|nr:hypothetical protein RHGRI_012130 [Rhododendron griersonianum]
MVHQFKDVEQKREHHLSSEIEVEKELGVDKLAAPTSFNEPNQKKKKRSKSVNFETVKEQLEEVEETILQLAEVKSHWTRKIEVGPLQMDGKALLPEMVESV